MIISNFLNMLIEAVKPDSAIYGTISLLASLGTIWALIVTIKSVNENREQTRLLGKKNGMDHIFHEFESILDKIIYMRLVQGMSEIHFGKKAFYRAHVESHAGMARNKSNYDNISEYVTYLGTYAGTISLILTSIEDTHVKNLYYKKLRSEIRFLKDYVLPISIKLNQLENDSNPILIESIEAAQEILKTNFEDWIFSKSKLSS